MQNSKQQITHRGYARKSTEAEDRQALSIESQVSEDIKIAAGHNIGLNESQILRESKSAKNAFGRPVFEQLIKQIEDGEVQGIVAWHANRLSRNAIDAARLVDLFDKGKLVEIVTQQQVFRNTPQDKFMLTLFCSQAKMENDNKSIDVRRGLQKKCEMGYPPGVAKVGYINDYGEKGKRRILPDAERFELVKKLWEMFLTGKYSVRKLLEYSDKTLGLKTIQRNKEGGKPVKLSRIYEMLKDPFYAGFFYAKDEHGQQTKYQVNSSVPRMITEDEFWRVQAMLGRKGRPCPSVNKQSFAYVGSIRCGSCGGAVTAEHKHQLICSSCKKKFAYKNKTQCPGCGTAIDKMNKPVYLHYIYYHCTKRRNPDCPEKCVREADIDEYMSNHARDKLQISPALRDWCLNHFEEVMMDQKKTELDIRLSWERERSKKQKEYDELLKMKMRGSIDDDDFLRLKQTIKGELEQVDKALSSKGGTVENTLDEAKSAFNLMAEIADVFKNGGFEEKTDVLSELGSNLTLKDRQLSVRNKKLIEILENGLFAAREINEAFEPANTQANKDKTEVFASVCPTLLRR
ncbi:MAG: recombinase family protein [Candidatus Pacebacteria bacterium]|nr:recombinase family protein [Candidatus Paceibacterota bacterium]